MKRLYDRYHAVHLPPSRNRDIVWSELARYLQKYIRRNSTVLDLGAGYCQFINQIMAQEKYALDKYLDPSKQVAAEVVPLFGDYKTLRTSISNNHIDVIFASNFFEHLDNKELENYMNEIKAKLKSKGRLIVMQPNFKLCYRSYFDDYTHQKAWTDVSLCEYLISQGFKIRHCEKAFLPLSLKSRLPKWRTLIWLYLRFPIRPFAGQMLIVSEKI